MGNIDKTFDEMEEHYQKQLELALEHRQVAAILAFEIEIKHDMVHHSDDWTKEELIEVIDMLAQEREKVISDKEYREHKFNTMSLLFSLKVKEETKTE